jgi:hypothetical protein
MRMGFSKPFGWGGAVVISILALVFAISGLVLVQGGVGAAGTFNPDVDAEVSDDEHLANADITTSFNLPATDYNYKVLVSFTPPEFGPEEPDVPIGAIAGAIDAWATLGLVNGACNTPLAPHFDLIWASTDTSDTCTFDEQFEDSSVAGLKKGAVLYPDFLNRMMPGITPLQRLWGWTNVSGQLVSISLVVLEPGSLGYPEEWGPPSISVLNDIGDPGAAPTPGEAITDFCTKLETETTVFGMSEDNPATGPNEAGHEVRQNPAYGGTYTFRWYTESMPDAEGDGYETYGDTCPFHDNLENFKVVAGHPDDDGIDSACDPDPDMDCWPGLPPGTLLFDCDGDGFYNRGDNCPMLANPDQADEDTDDIGDACEGDVPESGTQCDNALDDDGDTRVNDGCPADGAAETACDEERLGCAADPDSCDDDDDGKVNDGCPDFGYGDPDDFDGAVIDLTLEADVDISGPAAPVDETPTPTVEAVDSDGDTVTDDIEELYGSDPEDADSTPEDLDYDAATCSDGVDNDGDGLIDGDDSGCAVVEETPTPTATGEAEYCSPVFPGTYNGLVRIDGLPAASGYQVTASIDGVQWGSAIVSGGRYALDIPDHLPTVAPCFEGGTITFALDGMTCTPTEDWASGIHTVDLACAPAAPPVTPPVTPDVTTPTPTTPPVTPTALPPSGAGGLSGSSPGLPLWAMALASWAGLMIVAGLGTLVAVKRS